MLGESLDDLLERIRAGLGGRTADAPIPPALDAQLMRTTNGPELVETFVGRAAVVGTQVQQLSIEELPRQLANLLRGSRQASLGFVDQELRTLVRAALETAGIMEARGDGHGMDVHFDSDVGITDVEAAIAETGTLVYLTGAERPRAASFVAPVHIALVREQQLVADLVDYLAHQPVPAPSSELLITGPSKTADIEGVLIQGVHGPGSVRVLLIRE